MNRFTQTEQNYLEIIGSLLKKVVKENNIPQEYFEKHFIDYNINEIITRTKERHKIFLSRCVKGYYLYKKPYNN